MDAHRSLTGAALKTRTSTGRHCGAPIERMWKSLSIHTAGAHLMGLFSGRVTFVRFRVNSPSPGMFGPEHLECLEAQVIGKQRTAASDGVEVGWIAGDHILDTRFDLAKNIVNDALHFALRVDTNKLPSDLLRAYTQVDLQALAKNNPSGLPSGRQKREARDS